MFQGWRRLTLEQRKVWTIIGSGLVVVGAAKAGYFYFSRNLLVTQADRRHKEAGEKLKESYEFADWSHREREKQLPQLTTEERRQMNNFLNMMMEHEMRKHFPEDRPSPPAPQQQQQ